MSRTCRRNTRCRRLMWLLTRYILGTPPTLSTSNKETDETDSSSLRIESMELQSRLASSRMLGTLMLTTSARSRKLWWLAMKLCGSPWRHGSRSCPTLSDSSSSSETLRTRRPGSVKKSPSLPLPTEVPLCSSVSKHFYVFGS